MGVGNLYLQGFSLNFPPRVIFPGNPRVGGGKMRLRNLENSHLTKYNLSNKKTPQGG